jgi:UDP-glucose 4-epimerase
MNDPVFLLGAGGFIGRHLARRLADDGREVIAATRRPLAFAHPRIRNAVSAWDERGQFAEWIAGCGAVVHAASSSTPGSSAAQPQLEGNLRTTLALVEALQDAPSPRLLYLSSGGTLYGERESPALEDDPLRPRSYHGAGKIAAESFIRAWAAQYAGTAAILRPSNVYGPGQPARSGFGIIPAAFDCALHGRPLTIWGDGATVRDYLYVDALLALCEAAVSRPLEAGAHAFNAGHGQGIAVADLLDLVEAVAGRPIERRHAQARRVDIRSVLVDNAAARAAFGWTPQVGLEDGLRRTWAWFRDQA